MSFLIPTGTSQLSACKYLSGASMFDGSVLASMSMSGCVPGMQMKLCIKMLDNKSPRDLTTSHISPSDSVLCVRVTGNSSPSMNTFLKAKTLCTKRLLEWGEIKPGVEQYELGSSSWNFTSGYYHHKSFQSKLNSDSYKSI